MKQLFISSDKLSEYDKNVRSLIIKYFLSCSAAAVAETVTYPLDLLKTRLQIQGELKKKVINNKNSNIPSSNGMFRIAVNIGLILTYFILININTHSLQNKKILMVQLLLAKNEGFLQFWAGVTPAVYRHLVYTGSRLVFYEQFRDVFRKNANERFPLWLAVVVGCSSGALAQFIASPTDLVKVIMQAEGKKRLEGQEQRIKSVSQAFVQIYKEGGIRGLWRGSVVNVQRAALVSLGDLTTYDLIKRYIMRHFNFNDDYKAHTVSSICSGLIAATMGTPADVIKTRIMCQPTDSNGKGKIYKSSWHCIVLTFTHEGFFGLYKGFWPTWLRMAPWSLTFWLTYEEIRKLFGLNGF